MFDRHRQKQAMRRYKKELADWQSRHDELAEAVDDAKNWSGEDAQDILLHENEKAFIVLKGAQLVEDRRTRGYWSGSSSGISVPIGSIGGRSMRYRIGSTRGHYEQGQTVPTAIDQGDVYVTNQRIIFQGSRQTRECRMDKLLGLQRDDEHGITSFSVTNRQKPTTILYGPSFAKIFDSRLDLALAHFEHQVDDLIAQREAGLAEHDAHKPQEPVSQ